MPELPDITIYAERLAAYTVGRPLRALRIASPFLLRSVDPPVSAVVGKPVVGIGRIGKRLVLDFDDDLHVVIHLMIAGRLRWKPALVKIPHKLGLAAFDFDHGSVLFTEASKKKRASLHVVRGTAALAEHGRGGIDLLTSSTPDVITALRAENHTIKRALTDPTIIDGVGNAYSDEILWAAQMSPFRQTRTLSDDELAGVHLAARTSLTAWIERLRAEVGDGFPDEVTAFRAEMAVHGKYGQPCPRCAAPVQRIVYADNEANYCARCQTDGKLLADRGLSRLLKADWPRTLEALEDRKVEARAAARESAPVAPALPAATDTGTAPVPGKKPRRR